MKIDKWAKRSGRILVGICIFSLLVGCGRNKESKLYSSSKLNTINKYLQYSYLGEYDETQVVDSIFSGYIEGLGNPLTIYLDEEAYRSHLALEEGKIISTGMTYQWSIDGNHIIITDVLKGSSADEAGIKIGDKVIAIDDIKVIASNESEIYNKLTYTGSNLITYQVEDNNNGNKRKVQLQARLIDRESFSTKIIDQVGYIKLEIVKVGTTEKLKVAMKELEEEGVKGYVLDVRNLYANNVEEILALSDLFLDEELAFNIIGKGDVETSYYTTDGKVDLPIVILMNSSTSGAMEAFVSALKGQITLVGRTSAGISYITEVISLDDETGIRLATGEVRTSEGSLIVNKGIAADIEAVNDIQGIIELLSTGKISYENDKELVAAVDTVKTKFKND